MKPNPIKEKSYAFALSIVELYKYLTDRKREYVMSKQLLRCGTSIGANIAESISAESKADFRHKMAIALKEANETQYWITLLTDAGYLSEVNIDKYNSDITEITKILKSIILSSKAK